MTVQDIPLLIKHFRNTESTNTTNSLTLENLLIYHKRIKLYIFLYNRLILAPRIERKWKAVMKEARAPKSNNEKKKTTKQIIRKKDEIHMYQRGTNFRQFQELKWGGN